MKRIVKAGKMDPSLLVERLIPALHARTKTVVKQSLTLLDLAARTGGDARAGGLAAAAAVEALVHESPDIQQTALELIERHGNPGDLNLRSLLRARLDVVAASQRSRLEAWLGEPAETAKDEALAEEDDAEIAALVARAAKLDPRLARLAGVPEALAAIRGEAWHLPALDFDGTEIPRLDPQRRLEPIEDLDRLISLCSHLLETPEASAEDLDRCIDGISRLCEQRPADFQQLVAPLVAMVRNRIEAKAHMIGSFAYSFFLGAVSAWLTDQTSRTLLDDSSTGHPGLHGEPSPLNRPADRDSQGGTSVRDPHPRWRLDRSGGAGRQARPTIPPPGGRRLRRPGTGSVATCPRPSSEGLAQRTGPSRRVWRRRSLCAGVGSRNHRTFSLALGSRGPRPVALER